MTKRQAKVQFHMRRSHWLAALMAGLIVLPCVIAGALIASFDPNRWAPDIMKAVARETGRQVVLGAPIKLKLSLTPTLSVQDVSVLNPAGFATPSLMHLDGLQAQIALWPLLSHRLDIIRLVLIKPDIQLSTNQAGQGDWDLSPSGQPIKPGHAAQAARSRGAAYKIALESVVIQNGQVTIQRPQPSQPQVITIDQFEGHADSPSTPLHIKADARFNGTEFSLAGLTGPVERFSGIGSGPWPVDLALSSAGLQAHIAGSVAQPRTGRGYDVQVTASIPSLPSLAAQLAIGVPGALPPLQNLTASARIRDQDAAMPAVEGLSITAGAADLSAWFPGLKLDHAQLSMAALDQPVTLTAAGDMRTTPWAVTGTCGALQALLNQLTAAAPPPQGSYPVSIQVQSGQATIGIAGAIATPATLAGAAFAINASIPDLAPFGPALGWPLPGWKNITLQATLIDPGGQGLAQAVGLDGIVLQMDNAALGGDARLFLTPAPQLQAAVQIQAVNLDGLLGAMPKAPASTTAGSGPLNATAPAGPAFVIPSNPLPLALLRQGSADIQVSANTVTYRHTDYANFEGHLILGNGTLTINPLDGDLPGGAITASATLDAAKEPAVASVSLNAPALALSPLLGSVGLPDSAQGTMQAAFQATSTGDSLHDLAARMNGQLGLAMVNGNVDGTLLGHLFGAMLEAVGLPGSLAGTPGPVAVRCFAFRLDSANGLGTVNALTLDSSRLLVEGGGSVAFGPETLGVTLRPQMRLTGDNIAVPVKIGGTFAAPVLSIVPGAAATSAAQAAAGLTVSLAQKVLGKNAVPQVLADAPADVCPQALALGRLGATGPAAPPMSQPANATPLSPLTGPKNLLNALFGK